MHFVYIHVFFVSIYVHTQREHSKLMYLYFFTNAYLYYFFQGKRYYYHFCSEINAVQR